MLAPYHGGETGDIYVEQTNYVTICLSINVMNFCDIITA